MKNVSQYIKIKSINTIRKLNKELRDKIIEHNDYDLDITYEIEEEIYLCLLNSKYYKGVNKMEKIITTENGVNLKILSKDLCCIYGDENSSNYFISKQDLEKLLQKEWN